MCLFNHLFHRGAVYWFRRRIPSDLPDVYPDKQEFRYSLKTKDPHKAKEKARLEAVQLDEEFAAARIRKQRAAHVRQAASAPLPPLELSDLEIDRLALLYLQEILRMNFCLPLEKNQGGSPAFAPGFLFPSPSCPTLRRGFFFPGFPIPQSARSAS